jgi:hypothetical protein
MLPSKARFANGDDFSQHPSTTRRPTLTTICATFLAWKLKAVSGEAVNANAFTATFLLLSLLQALLCIVAFLLPLSLPLRSYCTIRVQLVDALH